MVKPACLITSLCCLNLNSVLTRFFFCLAFWGFALLTAPSYAWTVASRELVDLEYAPDQSLRILVSAPGATAPGLYRWLPDGKQPKLLCHLASPVTFSFDRTLLIERLGGEQSQLRIYNASNCRLLARIRVDGKALDTDARGRYVAVAVRKTDNRHELRLYSRRGRVIATAPIGRNVEMGFSPDGRSLVNFDLSDKGAALWRIPTLATITPPAWLSEGEATFVPGSAFIKHYARETLSVARWPGGQAMHSVTASRAVRLRELSANGRFGVLHERQASGETLDWIDFSTQRRVSLAAGSVDHATINATGNAVAWSLRDADKVNEVRIRRALVANGRAEATAKD